MSNSSVLGVGRLICRKKRKLEKQNSLEYMDQNDDRLKSEGELSATHWPSPSALRSERPAGKRKSRL